jgi:hypothetical protein
MKYRKGLYNGHDYIDIPEEVDSDEFYRATIGHKVNDRVTRGRCYDHNFLRFLPIFGEKMAFFSKTNVMIKILHNSALFLVKNAKFFAEFFGENILKS